MKQKNEERESKSMIGKIDGPTLKAMLKDRQEIVVLDTGIEEEATPSGQWCCWGPIFPFR